MCNTTSELIGVGHPRGPHASPCSTRSTRSTPVQHLPFPGVEQPQTRFFAAAGALAVISKHTWFIRVPLGYSICPLCGRSTSAPVCQMSILVAAVRQLCDSCATAVQQLCNIVQH